jgi:hypothetical protein
MGVCCPTGDEGLKPDRKCQNTAEMSLHVLTAVHIISKSSKDKVK